MIQKLAKLYPRKLWAQALVPLVAMVTSVSMYDPNENLLLSLVGLLLMILQGISTLALFVVAIRCLMRKQWWTAILRLCLVLAISCLGFVAFIGMAMVNATSRVHH